MPAPREIIEDIRRNEYGVGLPPGSPERLGFDKLRPKLDRAIQHLSEDLYTEDIHFVLELVQNADDNGYRDGVTPFLRFVRREGILLVQNNETGFEEKHVRALCSIGESSKSKAFGYIGEKGIGFKSVFRVSDEPHVVSNGFSFRFHRQDPATGLGYVVPEWVEEVLDFVVPSLTNIVLPLRRQAGEEVQQIERLAPGLLLFLKKLKRIEVQDDVRGRSACHKRIDRPDGVELRTGGATTRYRLVSRVLEVPPASQDVKRQGVSHAEVMLAFPVAEDGRADASSERHVYAYLPVRPYGFRFLVQADFILSSNRESILADRPWNQWLRDQVAPLFLQAVESFKQDQGGLRTTFLAYVPEQKPAAPFDGTRGRIIDGLREAACILSAPGQWAVPVETVLDSFGLRPLIGDDDVRRLLRRDYVDASFLATRSLLQSLGVLIFGLPELVRCLGTTEWLKGKPDEWFARLFARLASLDLKDGLEQLRALPLVPLEDGTLACVRGRRIFFPLDRETSYGFESRIPLVRRSLFDAADAETAAAARKFLRSLGVRKADPAEIIAEYVLPLFAEGDAAQNWQAMDDEFRIGSLVYIKDHLKEYEEAGHEVGRLQDELYVKYVHPEDRWYTRSKHLYLSEAYGNGNRLEQLLDGVPDVRFAHPVYLQRSLERLARRWKKPIDSEPVQRRRKKEVEGWRQFFFRLGVVETIRVVSRPTDAEPEQAHSPDLAQVFRTGDPDRLRQTFALLDANWSYYRQHLETRLVGHNRGRQVIYGRKDTEFAELLADSEWVPTTGGAFECPGDVYLDLPATRELLADEVAYLGAEIKDRRLIDDVDLRREATVEAVLARLRRLADQRSGDVATVRRLYNFLDQHHDAEATLIDSSFNEEPLFCLPGQPPRYLHRSLVFWQDVGPIFGDSRGCLSEHWPDLQRFFVHKLEVPLRPSPEDYAALLAELAEEDALTPRQERVVWAVYRELDRCLGEEADQITDQSWWKELVAGWVFWTDKDEFWANQGDLFVNDREDLYELFRGCADVAFLKLPSNQYPHISRFLKAAGIPLLSEAVTVEPAVTDRLHGHPGLTALCRQVAPFIIRYLFYREQDSFRQWQESGVLSRLGQLDVKVCDELHVATCLKEVRVPVRRSFASQFPTVFISRGEEDNIDGLAAELARMLRGSPGLEMFIAAALSRTDAQAVERLMQAQGIPPLPEDEANDLVGMLTAEEEFPRGEGLDGDATGDFGSGEDAGGEDGVLADQIGSASGEVGEDSGFDAIPVGSGAGGEPALRARTDASRDPEGPAGPRQPAASEHGEVDEEEGDELAGGVGSGQPATPGSPPAPPRSRDGEPETTPAVWSPACRPEQVTTRISEVVPSVVGGRTATTRGTAAGDRTPPVGPEDVEEPRPSPHAVPVGRWGEWYAVLCLQAELAARHPSAEVVQVASGFRLTSGGVVLAEVRWLNWQKDEGVGCDIEIVEGARTEYVEVKSTSDGSRASFVVTAAQWRLARQQGATYRILRVFHAGTPAARAESYYDPFRLWQEGRLTARLLQIVI